MLCLMSAKDEAILVGSWGNKMHIYAAAHLGSLEQHLASH